MRKIRGWLEEHEKQYELLRYLIAGGLTTVLSMLVSYGMCFLLAQRPPMENGALRWVVDSINSATPAQVSAANTVSWVIAVLFAFWINRAMVFRVKSGEGNVLRELIQFAGGRLLSFFLFEQGMMLALKWMGVSNIVNRVVVLVFVMVFNYVISKFWIFKQPSEHR